MGCAQVLKEQIDYQEVGGTSVKLSRLEKPRVLSASLVFALAVMLVSHRAGAAPEEAVIPPALTTEQGVARREPDITRYQLDLARVHLKHGFLDAASEALTLAEKAAKDNVLKREILTLKAEVSLRQEQPEAAVSDYRGALELAETKDAKADLSLRLAELLTSLGKQEEALRYAESACGFAEEAWKKERAQQILLGLYKRSGTLDAKIAELEQRAGAQPPDIDALKMLLVAYSSMIRNPEKAAEVAQRLADSSAKDETTLGRIAEAFAQARRYDDAVRIYEDMAKSDPENRPEIYQRIAQTYLQAGKSDEAVKWAQKVCDVAPENPFFWAELGYMQMLAGQFDEAVKAHEETIAKSRNESEETEFQFRLAAILERAGRTDNAAKIYERLKKEGFTPGVRAKAERQLQSIAERAAMIEKMQQERREKEKAPVHEEDDKP